MKRKLAVWLLKQFSPTERREIVMDSLNGLMAIHKRDFIHGLIPDGYHLHKDPRKKVAA